MNIKEDPRITINIIDMDNLFCTNCDEKNCLHIDAAKYSEIFKQYAHFIENYEPDWDEMLLNLGHKSNFVYLTL